ncbi:MAG: sigma-70 family RNA polymerase sigma factor [Actinomycetota bacterium]|nr:sigma-70 family RNA polymerase sigma factor [Actinomycetota bacterium]
MTVDRVEAVYRRIHPRLWRALLAFGADPELASDAVAEAFSQALRRGLAIRDVEAWVWRSAFRIASGMLEQRSHLVELDGSAAVVAALDWGPAELISQLQDLSPQQRAAVVLRYVGGFTPTEIASLLDTSPGAVRVQLHRAHAALRVTMEDSDGR